MWGGEEFLDDADGGEEGRGGVRCGVGEQYCFGDNKEKKNGRSLTESFPIFFYGKVTCALGSQPTTQKNTANNLKRQTNKQLSEIVKRCSTST